MSILVSSSMVDAPESRLSSRAAPEAAAEASATTYSAVRDERPIRLLNVLAASIVLLLSLPLWPLIALAIKLTSRGPVFYTQTRVGMDSRRRACLRRAAAPARHRRPSLHDREIPHHADRCRASRPRGLGHGR